MDANVFGLIRGVTPPNYAEGDPQKMALNNRGELLVAQALPEMVEIVRQGRTWSSLGVSTAALTAAPTTTGGYSIYNNEPANGKCYVIDAIGCVEIVTDATQQNSLALFAQNHTRAGTAIFADGNVGRSSMLGLAYNGAARIANGVGSLVDNGWNPHTPSSPGATAFAGGVWRTHVENVRGLYIVQPLGIFSIAAVKTVATASQIRYYIRWHEIQLSVLTS